MSERKLLIDSFLKRPIDNPSPYEGMIQSADGRRINFESPQQYSDTFDTLSFMAKWAETYHKQMARIAPLLEGRTRKETADNIFRFLYSSFQYSIDGQLQQLYNPASAWKNRFSGIDCKSYSIIASAILQNLGIPHAFRMVKQPGVRSGNEVIIDPEAWTHVYVVAFSDDGKNYYTIDATTHDNKEVKKIEKYDLMIKNLKHVGLSSPAPNSAVPIGIPGYGYSALGCNCGGCGHSDQLGISLGDITSMIGSLSCIGGSAYKSEYLQRNMAVLNNKFAAIVNKINTAVSASNMDGLSSAVAEFKVTANLIHTTYIRKKGSKDWNSCSKRNFDATIKAATFFKDICGKALEAWVMEYYVRGAQTSSLQISNEGWEDGFSTNTGMWGMKLTPWITVTEPKYSYSIKNTVRTIPAFAISEYLVQIEKSGTSFNWGQFVQGLTTVAAAFTGTGSGTGNGNGQGTGNGQGGGSFEDTGGGSGVDDTKMSTGQKVAIGAGVAALAFFMFQPSGDIKTLEKQYRQSNRPAKKRPAKTNRR